MLEHAVLMDTGLVRKGVGAHHRLVGLNRKARDARDQTRAVHDLCGIEAGLTVEQILTGAHRHHDLLERGVAGALAETVDGAFNLARTVAHGGERVGDRKPQVVVTMHREDRLVGVRDTLAQGSDEATKLIRDVVAHRVRNIDGTGAGIDDRLEHATEEVDLGASGILGRELHIVGVTPRPLNGMHRLREHLIRAHVELALHVDGRCGDEGMDPPGVGTGQRLAGTVDVLVERSGQTADPALLDRLGHGLDGIEIARTGNGETRLDHIDTHPFQGLRDAHLLVAGHGGARTLLAIAQGRIENDQVVFCGHGWSLSRAAV